MKIVVLGWGSLVWNPGSLKENLDPEFQDFSPGGPSLPLEFSRISGISEHRSEGERLTLVIDENHGTYVSTRFAIGTWPDLDSAKTALFVRERRRSPTEEDKIEDTVGYLEYRDPKQRSASVAVDRPHNLAYDRIVPWLSQLNQDKVKAEAVIWTALSSNYQITGEDFSVERAADYLFVTLSANRDALEYFEKAPSEIQTPLRIKVSRDPRLHKQHTGAGSIEEGQIPTEAKTPSLSKQTAEVRSVSAEQIGSPDSLVGKQSVEAGSVNGEQNLKEALGFLKDWVTALIAVETAAIGAFVAFLPQIGNYHHWQRWLLGLTLVCLFSSLWCGWNVLYMLPGCAQRKPDPCKDIYSLRTIDQPLGFWVRRFWYLFIAGAVCILAFYASRMGIEFLRITLVVAIVISAIYINWTWPINDWLQHAKSVKNRMLAGMILFLLLVILALLVAPRLPVTDDAALLVAFVLFIPIAILVTLIKWTWPNIDWSRQENKVKNRLLAGLSGIFVLAIIVSFVLPRWSVTKDSWNNFMAPALQRHDKAEYVSSIQASLLATNPDKNRVSEEVSEFEKLARDTEKETGVPKIYYLAIASGLALEGITAKPLIRDIEDVMAVNRQSFDCDTAEAISRKIAAMIKTNEADLFVVRLLELSGDDLRKFQSKQTPSDRVDWIHERILKSPWHWQAAVQFLHAVPRTGSSATAPSG